MHGDKWVPVCCAATVIRSIGLCLQKVQCGDQSGRQLQGIGELQQSWLTSQGLEAGNTATEQGDTKKAGTNHSSTQAAGVIELDASKDDQAEESGGQHLTRLGRGHESGRGQAVPTSYHRCRFTGEDG